jgi:tRNA(Ile)-lysidine synthase
MLPAKVEKTIKKYGLLKQGDIILIAFSGGPDSMALLLSLLELRPKWNLELMLGHFNHQLRRRAATDERFVRRIAEKNSLSLVVGSEDVRRFAAENRLNLEEAGRNLRYKFLRKTAQDSACTKIATGHTADDQTETFFMRLMRGSGLSGLAGIYPLVDGLVVRPLLRIERVEIEQYLEAKKASFVIDRSNADRRFLRNRIRLELVPFLQREFDPSIVSKIEKITSILQEDEAVLNELARKEAETVISEKDGRLCLDGGLLTSLPLGMARRIARQYIAALRGDLRGISYGDIEALLELETGKEYQIKRDLLLRREGKWIFRRPGESRKQDFEFLWSGESALYIPSLNVFLMGQRMRSFPHGQNFDDMKMAFLDWGSLRFPLTVRTRREGDRYRPYGAPGRKKLKEVLRAKNIPTFQREKLPVVLSAGEIVWMPGLPVSEKHRLSSQTEDIFVISVQVEPQGTTGGERG